MNDKRAVFVTPLHIKVFTPLHFFTLGLPTGDLNLTPTDVFIERDVKSFDVLGMVTTNEVGRVFGKVLAAFRHKVSQPLQHFVANSVPIRNSTFFHHAVNFGIEITAVVFKLKIEGHVVDPRAKVVDLVVGNGQVMTQLLGCPLHAMAEPNVSHTRVLIYSPTKHGHRIRVVQQKSLWTLLFHVITQIHHERNGAQASKNPANPQRIGDGLSQTIFLRNFKVNDGAGFVSSNLHHIDDIVCIDQGFGAFGGCRDCGLGPQNSIDLFGDDLTRFEALGIDVHERDMRIC